MPSDSQVAALNRLAIGRAKLNVDELEHAIWRGVREGAHRVADLYEFALQAELAVPIYPRSAPGEAPRRDTGELSGLPPSPASRRRARSGEGYTADVGYLEEEAVIHVGNSADHAVYLEYGTRRMAPRPHLRKVNLKLAPNIPVAFGAAVVESETKTIVTLRGSE